MKGLALALVAGCSLAAGAFVSPAAGQQPPMSFFITSAGPGNGANLGGLAGADQHCDKLAAAVRSQGSLTWRAYLSAAPAAGQPAVHAKDRIGSGPWHNAKGVQVPQSVAPEDAKQSVVVMLTPDELYVQGERVASVAEIRGAEDARIDALSAVLTRPSLARETTPESLADREITLIADKSLPYEVVKRVMSTCTREGYGRISLAVIEKDSPRI